MKYASTLLGCLCLIATTPALAGDLTIDLSGVQSTKGDLYVGVQTRDQFLKESWTYNSVLRAPKAGDHNVVIKDVAPGDYSISVWHDVDGDKVFSKAASGIPTDGWSMIGAETLRSEPVWDQVKISVPAAGNSAKLAMIYAAQ